MGLRLRCRCNWDKDLGISAQEFDFGLKGEVEFFFGPGLDEFNQGQEIGSGGRAGINDKIGVFFGNLGPTDAVTFEV